MPSRDAESHCLGHASFSGEERRFRRPLIVFVRHGPGSDRKLGKEKALTATSLVHLCALLYSLLAVTSASTLPYRRRDTAYFQSRPPSSPPTCLPSAQTKRAYPRLLTSSFDRRIGKATWCPFGIDALDENPPPYRNSFAARSSSDEGNHYAHNQL